MRHLRWSILLLLPLVLAGKCDKEGNLIVEPDEFSVVVNLSNDASSQEPIHIFVAALNETFPCCQVATGGARNVQLTLRPVNSYVFRAGRAGTIRDEFTCRTTLTADRDDTYRVIWVDSELLPAGGFLFCGGTGWEPA